MNPHYQSNKSIEAHKEDLRLLKNPSGVSLPPSTRSYNHQNLLTEQPTPQDLLIPASQFEEDDSQEYLSPPGRSVPHSQFYVQSPGTPGESIISAPGGKMTMMDRLQQNHEKMSSILPDLVPLKSDYTMDELCYLLMDHNEALIENANSLVMAENQEYLSTLNRRLMEQIQGLRKEKKKQEGNRTRAEVQTEYIQKQLQHAQKQVQEYKTLLAKSGIDIDKKIAELQRKDKEEIKNMKFLMEQQSSNLALKNEEIKQLRASLAHIQSQQTGDQDRVVTPLMEKIQQQKDFIVHLEKRLKQVITASKIEFPLYSGQPPFGTLDTPTCFLSPSEIRNNQEGIKNMVVNEFEKETMLHVFMNQASTIEKLLQTQKTNESLPGRLTNVFNQGGVDDSQDLEESKKEEENVVLQEKYDTLLKERNVLEKAINEAIEREGKLNQQYKDVLDMMQTLASESLKAITAEDQDLFEYSDDQDSATKKFLEEKSIQVPDPQYNRLSYLELIDSLFKDQKFSLASKLWRRIGYEAMTHTSLERNNELLRIAIKLRDRNFKKQSKQIQNLKGEPVKGNSSQLISKENSSRDNLIGEEYLMRNDSIMTQNVRDSGNLMTPQIREKLEEYEKLKKEHEEVKTAFQSGKSLQAKQLQRIMSAKLEESEQELNEMLAYGPRLSSRESVFSLRDSMKASKRPSVIFFQLQEENSQLREKLENLVSKKAPVEEESPFKEMTKKKEESRLKDQERNIAIIDTIFANLSLVTDQVQKGRAILKIPDLGDQEGLIKRTTTACEIAKQGKASLLTTFNLLKELFSITGELERLTSEFVLHLQLGVSRKRAAEAMNQEPRVVSPQKRGDIFSSPISSINPNQSPYINSPDFNSNVKTTSRIIGSPDKKQTNAVSSQRYTQQITLTKDKARNTYQNFLEADLKAPTELSQEHVRGIKGGFFDIYHLFGQMQKQAEALLLELAICEQRLSLQQDSAKNGYELSQKLRECEQELAQWKQGYSMPQTALLPGQLSASQSVEKDYLEKRVALLERRADTLSGQNQNLQHKVNLKEEEVRQKTQTANRLENVINLRDERIKNLEAIVEDMKKEVEDAKEIESQIQSRLRARGGIGRAENDLKRIVELERQRNKFRRELQRLEMESKDLLMENQELKLINQELSKDKQDSFSPKDSKPQIIYTHPSVLQHIPETSSVSDPQNDSLANTTEVLCLSGSFMNSARKSNFNSPQRDRNSTFKTIKSQQIAAARESGGSHQIMSPTFSDHENNKIAEMQEKYENSIKLLEDTINEHKKVIREERTQAALQKESLQQQLFNVVSQLEALQNAEEERQDFAQLYYALVEKVEIIRNMLQPVGESANSSPARSQRMRSQTGGSEYIVKHIQKRIKELQQKLITYEGLIDKAIQRVGSSTSTPGQIQEVELLRSENKLLRDRIEVSEENMRKMEQLEEEQREIISSLDLNQDQVVKEYMRQVVALLQEHGLDEGLVIENVRVKDLFERVIKLVHQLKNEIQKQFQDINDASLALSSLRAQGAMQGENLGLSFDEMRKLVRAENSEKLRDQELLELEQEMQINREENKRLQGQLALSQNAEQIESMKSRQTLIHYASQIDKLRQEIMKLKTQNQQLLTFKQKTSQELLALIHRLREEKQLQQSMSAQLQHLTQELKQVRQDQQIPDSPFIQKTDSKQFFPQVDDISLQKKYGSERPVKGVKSGHAYRRSGQFR